MTERLCRKTTGPDSDRLYPAEAFSDRGGVAEDNGSQLHRAARCAIALKWLKDETE